jgi:hypothetical protein
VQVLHALLRQDCKLRPLIGTLACKFVLPAVTQLKISYKYGCSDVPDADVLEPEQLVLALSSLLALAVADTARQGGGAGTYEEQLLGIAWLKDDEQRYNRWVQGAVLGDHWRHCSQGTCIMQ